jgi:hypothetical protein
LEGMASARGHENIVHSEWSIWSGKLLYPN